MKKLIFSLFVVVVLFACSSDDDNAANQCSMAIDATFEAMQDFDSATTENYVQMCTAYKLALQNQIQACGDADGSLQAIIDHLGDCTDITGIVTGEITVTAGTLNIVFDLLSVEQDGNLLKISGETSASNDYTIYFEVEENMQGENIFQNFEIVLITTYFPMEPNFMNNVTTNTSGTLTGTFSGVVENNDGGQLNLTNGNFDLSY